MFVYRLALTLLAPVIALWFALRRLRGRETHADLRERLGFDGPATAPTGPVIWLHGASNGELTSARGLIEALLRSNPALRIIITSNSQTGRDMVRGWNLPRLRARLAPLDYRACLSAFLSAHRPAALLLLEGDLWPNRMILTAQRGTPIAMVSARISQRSADIWRRLPALCRPMMRAVTLLSAQDAASEERFRDLGVAECAIAPQLTLKASVLLPVPATDDLAPFRTVFDRDETLLAASTHEGEEEPLIEAFRLAQRTRPTLKLILAPRHPSRGAEVAALLGRSGLRFSVRSAGAPPTEDVDVYLADTLGEMPLWYALAGQCFVGGSLAPKGGHTPYEPAQFDCAILHGPDLRNFAEQYAALTAASGAIGVEDGATLGAALADLDALRRAQMCAAARNALSLDSGADLQGLLAQLAEMSGDVDAPPPIAPQG